MKLASASLLLAASFALIHSTHGQRGQRDQRLVAASGAKRGGRRLQAYSDLSGSSMSIANIDSVSGVGDPGVGTGDAKAGKESGVGSTHSAKAAKLFKETAEPTPSGVGSGYGDAKAGKESDSVTSSKATKVFKEPEKACGLIGTWAATGNMCTIKSIDGETPSVYCNDEHKVMLDASPDNYPGVLQGKYEWVENDEEKSVEMIGFYNADCSFSLVSTTSPATFNGRVDYGNLSLQVTMPGVLVDGARRAVANAGNYVKESGLGYYLD